MKVKSALFLSMAIAALISCDNNKKHARGKSYDSLFLGINLGMNRQDFYEHCAELNRQKVFTHGPGNNSVQFMLVNELEQPVVMRFYPDFYQERIVDMPVTFSYEAWAPWNKQYSSDVLFPKMLLLFERWYGKDFKMMEHPTMGTLFYKIDGKRRINLFIRDDQYVQAVFTDMELDRERENEIKKRSAN